MILKGLNNMTKELMARCKKYNFNDELINLINGAEGMFELLREVRKAHSFRCGMDSTK